MIRTRRSVIGGFTLLELMLVATVLAVLLAASLPRFQRGAQRLRAERAAFEVVQLLRMAHERAVTSGQGIVWVWDPGMRSVHLYALAGASPEAVTSQLVETHAVDASPSTEVQVTLTRQEALLHCDRAGDPVLCAECGCLHFYPDGTNEDGGSLPTVVRIARDSDRYEVTVHAATSHVVLRAGTPAR